MLPATVWAPCDVDAQLLLESGEPFIQFFHQPSREALRFGDCQLAEFCPGARDCSAEKRRAGRLEANLIQLARQLGRMPVANIDDQEILHIRGTHFASGEAIGKIRGSAQLLRFQSPAQHRRTNNAVALLFLPVNAYVIAIYILGREFGRSTIECEAKPVIEFCEKGFGIPTMFEEEELQADRKS